MPRDGKQGYAPISAEKETVPGIEATCYPGVEQRGGSGGKIQHTNETRRGDLNTNSNIGCGYGTVSGKGKKD